MKSPKKLIDALTRMRIVPDAVRGALQSSNLNLAGSSTAVAWQCSDQD